MQFITHVEQLYHTEKLSLSELRKWGWFRSFRMENGNEWNFRIFCEIFQNSQNNNNLNASIICMFTLLSLVLLNKYHLLKSYDYDIIYCAVFVAIYVCQSPKICFNINFTSNDVSCGGDDLWVWYELRIDIIKRVKKSVVCCCVWMMKN